MKRVRSIVAAVVVGVGLTLAMIGSADAYTGHAGCPSWVAPYATVRCAWHSNVRRAVASANQSHWVWADGRSGSCSGACNADTGYGPYGWSGYTTVGNETGAWMYIWWVDDYS